MKSQLSVNVIARDSQYGLRHDRDLIKSILEANDFRVRIIGNHIASQWTPDQVESMRSSPYDLNLFIESFYPECLGFGRRQLLMPHQEWFFGNMIPQLRWIDTVICKSMHATEIFSRLGCRTVYAGFTSIDRRAPGRMPKDRQFLCLNSNATDRVLAVWLRHPEWPRLTITTFDFVPPATAPNIRHVRHFLSDEEVARLRNEQQFHLCVSRAEGFGHKLNEGLSCGAVVITTNAPPMNELVGPERGILVKVAGSALQGVGTAFFFDEADLEKSVERCLRLSPEEIERIAVKGRAWFEESDAAFRRRFPKVLRALV